MLEGAKIQLGERSLVMPKLSVGILKRHWPTLAKLRAKVEETKDEAALLALLSDMMTAQTAIIHAALKRNYPELTLEEVEDDLGPGDVRPIFEQLVSISHFEKKELSAPGEATAT